MPGHVRNSFGEINEAWVEARRSVPGSEVLAEFVDTTNRRIDALVAMTAAEFDTVGWSPVGDVPYREFMATRVLDSWAHEQDIRRALDRPGGRNGAGERVMLDRCEQTMPYVVGKRAAAAGRHDGAVRHQRGDGSPGPGADGRRPRLAGPGAPGGAADRGADHGPRDVLASVLRAGAGPRSSGPTGSVAIEGDDDLGRRVLAGMAFMI